MCVLRDIVIVGAGGCAREVAWLLEENNKQNAKWNILGYVADEGNLCERDYPLLGNDEWLLDQKKELDVVIAVGNGTVRKKIYEKLQENTNLSFPIIVSNRAIVSDYTKIGKGTIICAGTIVTIDIEIGEFCYFNLYSTVSHDCVIEDYVTVYSNVNISGNVTIGERSTLGVGTKIKQGVLIGKQVVTGAGTVVVKDVEPNITVVGCPAKRLEKV